MATSLGLRSVLVSGASRGIGLETALTIAASGYRVWAGVRTEQDAARIRQMASARNTSLEPVYLDVTSESSVDDAFRRIEQSGDSFYGLVNNAGVTGRSPFETFPEDALKRIFDVNVFGTMRVTRRALPALRKTGAGRIIFVSSIGGRIGSASVAPYVGSKFAVEGFAESLNLETQPFGIAVSIIEPGIVKTDIWDEEQRVLPPARDPSNPYYKFFWAGERQAEKLLNTSTLTPADVAVRILHALNHPKPKLRYIVGWRAALVVALRRHLPGELFERLYFGEFIRRVRTGADAVAATRSVAVRNDF